MNKKTTIIIFGLILISLYSTFVSAVCTVTFDKTTYSPGETVTAAMSCNDATEKLKPYNLLWANQSGGNLLETDTGTTPSTIGQSFFHTYNIPLGIGNFTLNATLTGTSLEGYDNASIFGAPATKLIITNGSFTQPLVLIGRKIAIEFFVKDSTNKLVSNAECLVHVEDSINKAPIESSSSNFKTIGGIGSYSQYITADNFKENKDYAAFVYCQCGQTGLDSACINEDGVEVASATGSAGAPFKVHKWLNVNTVVNFPVPELKQQIFICANVTNLNYSSRIPMEIYHQIRCSHDIDQNSDLDRVIVVSDDDQPDERGIGVGTTQMQCKTFIMPEARHLQGRDSQCYASTNVWVVNEQKQKVIGYATTSPYFNITGSELQIDADWEFTQHNIMASVVNLSHPIYSYYNGTGIGNIDIRLGKPTRESLKHEDQYDIKSLYISDLIDALNIHNITVNNGSVLQRAVNWQLEYLNDGYIEIEIRDVDISRTGWYNITVEFDNFPERQTVALENSSTALQTIANNTGTFFFDINMESDIYGSPSVYTVTAIREFGAGDLEGTFECYIDGYKSDSVDRWQQSIKYPDGITSTRVLSMPDSAPQGQSYTIICKLGTAGLGNTITTATKTFTFNPPVDTGSPGTSSPADIIGKTTEFAEKLKRPIGEQVAKNPLLILLGVSLLFFIYKRSRENEVEGEYHGQ